MKLRVKKQFENQVITKRFIGLGNFELNTGNVLSQDKMKHYYNNGFSDVFEYYVDEQHIIIDKPANGTILRNEILSKLVDETNLGALDNEVIKSIESDETKLGVNGLLEQAKKDAKNYKKNK